MLWKTSQPSEKTAIGKIIGKSTDKARIRNAGGRARNLAQSYAPVAAHVLHTAKSFPDSRGCIRVLSLRASQSRQLRTFSLLVRFMFVSLRFRGISICLESEAEEILFSRLLSRVPNCLSNEGFRQLPVQATGGPETRGLLLCNDLRPFASTCNNER
jgi:hypothetical protein